MFYLVGIGLRPEHLTLEAQEILKNCDQVFLETYTSQYSEGKLQTLKEKIGNFQLLGREEVETKLQPLILSSKKNNIALMIFGNALTATTHMQLLLDAKEAGIKYKVIPGISITNTIAESGLDEYKFGRIVTICYHLENYEPETFFDQIIDNRKISLHTLCLLDIKKDEKPERMMNCKEAIQVLEKIAKKREQDLDWEYLALIGMANENQKIIFGKEKIFNSEEVEKLFPQSLIILGKTNEKEKEFLESLE
jgi:diphthine synthase